MILLPVTDDQGERQYLNVALIQRVKARPKTALGTVIHFQNGTSLAVIEGVNEILRRLGVPAPADNEG